MRSTTFIAAALAATAQAAKDERTFAVLRFIGGGPLMEGRVDPIVSPGMASSHVHTFEGGSNMGVSATGEDMMQSSCSTALVVGDNSGYWMPKLYFRDPTTSALEDVELYYMNVYYFFEATDDDISPFPVGLQMISGNSSLRECPNFGGALETDAGNADGVQPVQWTCPRSNYNTPAWPSASQSDGSREGIADPVNQGAGQGFPFGQCDGLYSPLRHDLHFPSCYDPSKALTDYKNNMAFPTTNAAGKQNCPDGWLHVPHMFYEMYWNTQVFSHRWTPNQGIQPFVLSNGDLSGCSGHGDFLAAWDHDTLANIIANCNAGDSGMDLCPGVTVRDRDSTCTVASPIDEVIAGNLTALPGSNPIEGWGMSFDGVNPADTVAAAVAVKPVAAPVVPDTTPSTVPVVPAPVVPAPVVPAPVVPAPVVPAPVVADTAPSAAAPVVVADIVPSPAAPTTVATPTKAKSKSKCHKTRPTGASQGGVHARAHQKRASAHVARHHSPHLHHGR